MWKLAKAELLYWWWLPSAMLVLGLSAQAYVRINAVVNLELGPFMPTWMLLMLMSGAIIRTFSFNSEAKDNRLKLIMSLPVSHSQVSGSRIIPGILIQLLVLSIAVDFSRLVFFNHARISIWMLLSLNGLACFMLFGQMVFHELQFMSTARHIKGRIIMGVTNGGILSVVAILPFTKSVAWRLMAKPEGVAICCLLAAIMLVCCHRIFMNRQSYLGRY